MRNKELGTRNMGYGAFAGLPLCEFAVAPCRGVA